MDEDDLAREDAADFLKSFSPHDILDDPGLYDRLIHVCVQGRGGHSGLLSLDELFELYSANPGQSHRLSRSSFNKAYRSHKKFSTDRAQHLAHAMLTHPKLHRTDGLDVPAVPKKHSARSDEDAPLYEIINHRLAIDPNVARRFFVSAAGYYQMWRHSTQMPGHFSKGLLRIYHTRVRDKGYVQAWQRYADGSSGTKLSPMQRVEEEVAGFIFPVARNNCLMLTRGTTFVGFRLSIFTDIEFVQPGDIVRSMTGYVTGTDGGKGFTSIIYLERIDTTTKMRHDDEMNIYPPDVVPPKVAAILNHGTFLTF